MRSTVSLAQNCHDVSSNNLLDENDALMILGGTQHPSFESYFSSPTIVAENKQERKKGVDEEVVILMKRQIFSNDVKRKYPHQCLTRESNDRTSDVTSSCIHDNALPAPFVVVRDEKNLFIRDMLTPCDDQSSYNSCKTLEDMKDENACNLIIGSNDDIREPLSPQHNTTSTLDTSKLTFNTAFFTPKQNISNKLVSFGNDFIDVPQYREDGALPYPRQISPLTPIFTTARKFPIPMTPTLVTNRKEEHESGVLTPSSGDRTSITGNTRSSRFITDNAMKIRATETSSHYNNGLPPDNIPSLQGPSIHTQLFILSIAFLAIWSPQNLMAPNLTQMAEDFEFNESQRDLYLGAYIAFATGVLSLPVSAFIGFFVDSVSSRKKLFAYTVCFSGISSIFTGMSQSYSQLFFARLLCGGCMSGSVPVVFSLLGDLFDAKDRNIASSGLTAMMGAGILFGQVYAGTVGATTGWRQPFLLSGFFCIVSSLLVWCVVREPERGGKEIVLQELISKGTKYDRKLTIEGFVHAMTKNQTNVILMLQGFTTNVPWGVIFTFLNDYLSQEQGLSVPEATFLVFWFGIGSAAGGILGGYLGTFVSTWNRSSLPLFMALSTLVGILPFLGLLDLDLDKLPLLAVSLAFTGGCIANLPSVNVRPCLLNVNPPETRGAAMTAANLMINVARGAGPCLITFTQRICGLSRQYSFNITLIVFWSVTSILLLMLSTSLPRDQDAMDVELAKYAESKMKSLINNIQGSQEFFDDFSLGDEDSLVSLEDRIIAFDAMAAQESLYFIGDVLRGMGEDMSNLNPRSLPSYEIISDQNGHEVVLHDESNLLDPKSNYTSYGIKFSSHSR